MKSSPYVYFVFCKVIFIGVLLVAFCSFCLSQTNEEITTYEKYFRNVSKIEFVINGSKYYPSQFEQQLNFLLPEVVLKKSNWKTRFYKPNYLNDRKFAHILDTIDLLPRDSTVLKSPAFRNLQNSIRNTSDLVKRIQEILYVKAHFLHAKKPIDINLGNTLTDSVVNKGNLDAQGFAMRLLAFFYYDLFDFPQALSSYRNALYIYDSTKNIQALGETEERIGNMYQTQSGEAFTNRAFYHYDKAISYYHQINNTYDSLNVDLLNAIGKLRSNDRVTFLDWQFYNNTNHIPGSDVRSNALYDKILDKKEYALNAAFEALMYEKKQTNSFKSDSTQNEKWVMLNYNLYTLLGNYFSYIKEDSTAIIFYQAALFSVAVNKINYWMENVIEGIKNLSHEYAITGDPLRTLKYSDYLIALSHSIRQHITQNLAVFEKGFNFLYLGKFEEALKIAQQGFAMADTADFYDKQILFQEGAELKSKIFNALSEANSEYADSLNFYNTKLNDLHAYGIEDLDQMNQLETEYSEDVFSNKERNLNAKIFYLNTQYASAKSNLKRTIKLQKQLNASLTSKSDSLKQFGDSIKQQQASLTELQIEATNAIKQKQDALETVANLNVTLKIIYAIGSILLLSGLSFLYINYVRRKRDKFSLDIADAYSRNLSHNIASDFADFLEILDTNDFEKGKSYAEKSAVYLGHATNRFADKVWSIKNEMEMLNAYCEVKKKGGVDVEIISNFDLKALSSLKIPAGAFTTVFHNFIRHGKKHQDGKFNLDIGIDKGLIYILISDNGTPSSKESYIQKDKPNKGLSLLKKRIEITCKLKRQSKRVEVPFVIDPKPNVGTVIKMILPYEKLQNTIG